jgi:Protein of unknown function (DUF2752)
VKTSDYAAVAVLGVAIACLLAFDVTLCPLAGIFGVPCPSCGLTRATWLLITARHKEAFIMHPGIVVVWPYIMCVLGHLFFCGRRCSYDGQTKINYFLQIVSSLVLVVLLGLWLARFAGYWGGAVAVKKWL